MSIKILHIFTTLFFNEIFLFPLTKYYINEKKLYVIMA